MKILEIRPHEISIQDYKEFALTIENEFKYLPSFIISNYKKMESYYVQDIVIEMGVRRGKLHHIIWVKNSFIMKIEGNDLIPKTQEDFLLYAELVQISLAHTRVLLNAKFLEIGIGECYIPIVWMSRLAKELPSASFLIRARQE